jgi:hypothetical protein
MDSSDDRGDSLEGLLYLERGQQRTCAALLGAGGVVALFFFPPASLVLGGLAGIFLLISVLPRAKRYGP